MKQTPSFFIKFGGTLAWLCAFAGTALAATTNTDTPTQTVTATATRTSLPFSYTRTPSATRTFTATRTITSTPTLSSSITPTPTITAVFCSGCAQWCDNLDWVAPGGAIPTSEWDRVIRDTGSVSGTQGIDGGGAIQITATTWVGIQSKAAAASGANVDFQTRVSANVQITLMVRSSELYPGTVTAQLGFCTSCYNVSMPIGPISGMAIYRMNPDLSYVTLSSTYMTYTAYALDGNDDVIKVSAQDVAGHAEIKVYINSVLAFQTTDPGVPLPAGGVGVMCFGGQATFDDLKVNENACLAATPTPSRTLTYSATPTQTQTPTFTLTPTQAFPGTNNTLIEDFPTDMGLSQSGQQRSFVSRSAQAAISGVSGSPCGTQAHALRLSGTAITGGGLTSAYNDNAVYFDAPKDYSYVSRSWRTFSLRVKASALPTGRIAIMMLTDSNASAWGVFVPVTTGNWVNVTIALPDYQNPGALPQLALFSNVSTWLAASYRIVRFAVAAEGSAASAPYDLQVDDLAFGAYPTNSTCQKATAFGVTVAFAEEAQALGLDDQSTWIVLTLSKHCGFSPTQVLMLHATQSWGQIASSCGTDWATVLDEADTAAGNAGLEAELGTPDQWQRMMSRGTPDLGPTPTPVPYLPAGPVYLPPASGVCP